ARASVTSALRNISTAASTWYWDLVANNAASASCTASALLRNIPERTVASTSRSNNVALRCLIYRQASHQDGKRQANQTLAPTKIIREGFGGARPASPL